MTQAQTQAKEAPLFEALKVTMDLLAALMEEEMALLTKQNVEELKKVHEKKSKLVSNYNAGMKEIALNPALLRQAPAEARATLKKSAEKLALVSGRNAIALKGAVQGTKKLMEHVVRSVKEERSNVHSYANPQSFKSMRAMTTSPCSPIACNRTV